MIKVTKMTKCHYVGTKTVRSVSGNSAWRVETSDTCKKTGREGADVTSRGRPFQTRAPATGKTRSPMVDSE